MQRLNVSQDAILEKIKHYIVLRDKESNTCTDPRFLSFFNEGHCTGLSILKAFGLLTSAIKPDRDKNNCDDNEWFENCRNRIVSWDGKNINDIAAIMEPFIAKIVYFQKVISVLPEFTKSLGSLHKSNVESHYCFEYTEKTDTKEIKINHLTQDDCFIFPYSPSRLRILLEAAIPEDRMVLLGSAMHAVCVLKHQGNLFYYDPNEKEGTLTFNNFGDLAIALGTTLERLDQPHVLLVDIYRLEGQPPLQYLPSEKIKEVFKLNSLYEEMSLQVEHLHLMREMTRGKQRLLNYINELYFSCRHPFNPPLSSANNKNRFFGKDPLDERVETDLENPSIISYNDVATEDDIDIEDPISLRHS